MKTKNIPVNLKKIPYYLVLSLLTTGASLILGFLSFSGMYALLPVLPLAFGTFFLSVAYEGEIYLQNIKGALTKLFKNNYLENYLAKEYLLTHFPDNTEQADCPQFFRDYKAQLLLLAQYEHKELNQESKQRRKQIARTLKDMEHWFAQQLFTKTPDDKATPYALELQKWLAEHSQKEWQEKISQRGSRFNIVKGFSALAALFMGLGSTYLMVEAFSAIPFFATIPFTVWPLIILPLATVAGAAYGLLTYNAITDLINNNTVVKWYNKLKADLMQGLTPRNFFMAVTATFLATLAVALTVCTAGTWWTIATNARPLFDWMRKMPSFIMGVINPIITGASAIVFNIQNSAESLEMVDEALRSEKSVFQNVYDALAKGWQNLLDTENWLQMLNPFRLLLKLTITPLRILFFFGHLVSIALTSDRMPGVPQIVAALVAIISEGFEDAHYFIGGSSAEQCGHQNIPGHVHQFELKKLLQERVESGSEHAHGVDIPTWFIQTISAPIYALAAAWDSLASKWNQSNNNEEAATKRTLSFAQAWSKQRGIPQEENVNPALSTRPSWAWQVEHTVTLIDKQSKKLAQASVNRELAQEKITSLDALKTKVLQEPQLLGKTLRQEKKNAVYNKHRLFALEEQTSTQSFIEELPERVGTKNKGPKGAPTMWNPRVASRNLTSRPGTEKENEEFCIPCNP
ncbi:hypothetical protein [Legionella sp. km772]|uniref:hypothetical protein n=1 Tax=Legionella sp. km772 TaxID=2498111 RepID=UPI00268C3504|nr:hypothetical protein [Legionella sp. km772]